ncbi:O-linked N-acetylglucosamine transferase family protein [Pseudomonas nitroreducens]|uniref:protein O-GlcNAc transferase n=1 Tax=Pseudomonas nitroreducens TaxID=46680 RepID=A0A6G6ITV8_PSENT|nr:tetratricopeptide repeat protein [Pseudomonas nitroreducens]MBG6290826.1 tetratricopeptide repeat protein [Pseudomonas nitroreducens]QIE86383.1 tetratricopeptide repeat protein [Pseudomonas nitroreducens]
MRQRQPRLSVQTIVDALNSGAPARGEALARQLLRSQPRNAEALHLCGVACLSQGKATLARELIKRALTVRKDATYYLNLALAERALSNDNAVEEAFRCCLQLQPRNAQAANNLANLCNKQRRYAEAEQFYRQAIASNPGYLLAYKNFGNHLCECGQSETAIPVLTQALTLGPDRTDLQLELARALRNRKRFSEAAKWFAEAKQWDDLQLALRTLGSWPQLAAVDTELLQKLQTSPQDAFTPWSLINLPGLSPELHRDAARHFAESRWSQELLASPLSSEPTEGECLRIGYLSSDFYDHATMHLMMGVLEAHDCARVDIHLFDYSPERDDDFTRRIAATGLHRHNLRELSDEAAAKLIAEQRLHILVDLKGYTTGARQGITALRPAPVIINWLGYPGSLGHPRLADYLIGDPTVTPAEHAAHFSETLALMPHSYQPNDRDRPLNPPPGRTEVGLPEQGVVFASFNQLLKLNPGEFDLWCRLLREVPGAVLWLLEPEVEEARDNLRREAQQRGVAAERLIFAPRLKQDEHLARLSLADLALDSFPCTSHTTASDALWVGVPLITRLGETFTSRVAGSLLKAHGFDELVAKDAEDCFERLKALALNDSARTELRQRLSAARMDSPLFDTARFTRNLEALYQAIWQHHCTEPEERSEVVLAV